jgi:hypothetical protein
MDDLCNEILDDVKKDSDEGDDSVIYSLKIYFRFHGLTLKTILTRRIRR